MQPIWIPDEQTIAQSNIRATLDRQSLADYDQLYQWSIAAPNKIIRRQLRTEYEQRQR